MLILNATKPIFLLRNESRFLPNSLHTHFLSTRKALDRGLTLTEVNTDYGHTCEWCACNEPTMRKITCCCIICDNSAHILCFSTYILGQKRNAAYKTHCIWGRSPISRERFVTVWVLILGVWVPGVVLATIVTGRNRFRSLHLRFYRSWRRVITRWRNERARSSIVPVRQNCFLRRSIVHAWHRSFWAITDGITLACNILITLSWSTCVHLCIVN